MRTDFRSRTTGLPPRFRGERWNLRVFGATADGAERSWTYGEPSGLPQIEVAAGPRCATGRTSTDREWYGIPATAALDLVPPAPEITHIHDRRVARVSAGPAGNPRTRAGGRLSPTP
ncbi:hypothetical protein OHB54_40400 [Streptomyces sp. NBC_01007]|nr:hypothetical protein OHB54_40400 [Streptomyces sp. NBC_01007]